MMTSGMPVVPNLELWTLLWTVAAVYMFVRHWRSGGGVGLILCYVVSFASIHWLAPVLHLLPWYPSLWVGELINHGMYLSALGMIAFAVGAEFSRWQERRTAGQLIDHPDVSINPTVVNVYLWTGIILHVVLFPIARGIPSVTALVGSGSTLIVAGVTLKCWNAWQADDRRMVWRWLLASLALPLFTVVTQGFLGYGMAALMAIYAAVAAFYGSKPRVLILAALLAYLGLSVYVTYMRDRSDIRAVVWSGGSLGDRTSRVSETIANVEWFDIYNDDHLQRVDMRLNQNALVGAAVEYVGAGRVPFAGGSTVYDAMLSVIPRAIWPDKPVGAGSGELVSIYTGLEVAEGTSVGIGQVMEWYVNFGTRGVVVGFLIVGFLIGLIDRRAILALRRGDPAGFARWYIPGLSLLNLGGSFVEITSTASAALVMVALVTRAQSALGIGHHPRVQPELVGAPTDARGHS